MKPGILFCMAVFLTLVLCAQAQADEELAPGYGACMDKAVSTADFIDCASAAYKYWDKILNNNFIAAKKYCTDSEHPELCTEKLLKAQKLWIQYKEAMLPVIATLGGDGSLSRVEADIFAARETKKQAELLKITE